MTAKQLTAGLYKIEVPFEDIHTAVFLAAEDDRYVLIDSATTDADVDRHILPALAELGFADRPPEALLLSHRHGDHAGGAKRLSEIFAGLCIYSPEPLKTLETDRIAGGERFLRQIEVLQLSGHTKNSVGFYDRRDNTLISCDCLQLRGISRYRNGIGHPALYRESIGKLRTMPIKRIFASHEYDPLGSTAEGTEAVRRYLDECERWISVSP